MKKTSNFLSRMLFIMAFVGFAGTVSAQEGVIVAGAQVEESGYACVIGEPLFDANSGFLASLFAAEEVATGVKGVYTSNDVKIQSAGDGNITVSLPENLVAEGAYYCIYNASGAMLSRTEIKNATTAIETASLMNGKQPIIVLVGTRQSGKLTSVKLVK